MDILCWPAPSFPSTTWFRMPCCWAPLGPNWVCALPLLFQLSTVSAAFCFPLSHKLLLCHCLSSSDNESDQLWNHIKPRHLQMILYHVFFLEDLIIMWEIYKKGFPIKWIEFQSISPPPSRAQVELNMAPLNQISTDQIARPATFTLVAQKSNNVGKFFSIEKV